MNNFSQLTNIRHRPTEIELNGEKLLIEYDYRAYALLEEMTHKSVYELKDEILEGRITLTNRLLILFCGLLKHQENFSIKTLQKIPDIGYFLDKTAKEVLEGFFTPLLPPTDI